jgi:hypothetical protein
MLTAAAGMTGAHHCTQLVVVSGSHEFFAQAGLELILLISASQVARITGEPQCLALITIL